MAMKKIQAQQRAVMLHLPENYPIDIAFTDVSLTVPAGLTKGTKQILKGISGKFVSGELTAIMGPSGAGKSSMLNILTGFQRSGIGGTINSSNKQKSSNGTREYKKECCYILQDDRLTPLFTVQETMTMAADLKLGKSLSLKAKQFVIDEILDTLSLGIHKHTRCERLSGGQKKRLSIALELIDNPPVMFLDEPTTGLDSVSSTQCIAMLKSLARGGRTIICTIHQPTASVYEMFDHVYVLARGHCMYQGAAANTVAYLSALGLHCPKYHNPADYLMEVVNGDWGNFSTELRAAANTSLNCWRQIRDEPKVQSIITNGSTDLDKLDDRNLKKALVLVSPPSEWTKLGILLNRSFTKHYRDWSITYVKLLLHLCVGIILGLKYLNSGNDGSKAYRNVGYLLISSIYMCYTTLMPAVLRFPQELPVLKKERFNNWYCLRTYYAAHVVLDIPLQILFCTIYGSVSYVMSAQPMVWDRFFMFLLALVLITLTSESAGLLIGTRFNPVNGTFIGAIYTAVMLALAGFLALFSHMPRIFVWMSQLSFLRHGLQALVCAIYGQDREPLPCPEDTIYCHFRQPQQLLEEFSMADTSYWYNCGILVAFLVTLRVVAFWSLQQKLRTG